VVFDTGSFLEYVTVVEIQEQIRDAIKNDGRTIYALAKESGIDHGILYRFMDRSRGLNLDTVGRLLQVLGLEVRLVKTKKQ
jgi:hypothetical protein